MGSTTDIPIVPVVRELGGPELPRHGRVPAWWRKGDSLSVSIDTDKNCYYDFVTGDGGGALKLVQPALGCDRRAALRWLQDHCGLDAPNGRAAPPRDDVRAARYFAIATELLADELLETLPCDDPARLGLTRARLLARAGGTAVLPRLADGVHTAHRGPGLRGRTPRAENPAGAGGHDP
jgi:hypothetical protein